MASEQNPYRTNAQPAAVPALLTNPFIASVWAITAAFGTYFCMYAFRKPFTAASYEGAVTFFEGGLTVDQKTLYVSSQVLGYMVSKFIGIKVIAEMTAERRAFAILALIGIAEVALLLFGMTPAPWNFVFLFVNGLPLGMVFGLVLGFLEGRRVTEALSAGLCASFILADGVTKSVGKYLLDLDIPLYWMPATAGAIFLLPLLICVWMLTKIPKPTEVDEAARTKRVPMNQRQRLEFLRRYAAGLILLVVMYLLVTILRSLRADFSKELWEGLGYSVVPSMFTYSEMIVAAGVMVINGTAIIISDNRRGFSYAMIVSILGFSMVAAAILLRGPAQLSGFTFMVLIGLGLYLPYVAVHTTVFERLIAMTKDQGNIGFLLYFADAFGYLAYVFVMFGKGFVSSEMVHLDFFSEIGIGIVLVGMCCTLLSWRLLVNSGRHDGNAADSNPS